MRYGVFLRAVNVGGRNMVPMAKLVAALKEQGCENVSSYLQSGNLLLDTADRETLTKTISAAAGFPIDIAVLSVEELKEVGKALAKHPSAEYVTLFTVAPREFPKTPLASPSGDLVILHVEHAYALWERHAAPGKQPDPNKLLGATGTTRTRRVIEHVLERA